MTDLGDNSPKVAIVTGGSRGIGRAVVERLARAGVDVTFTFATQEGAAQEVASGLTSSGFHARALRVDARDVPACKALVAAVIAERGRIDLLVNNAAVCADKLLAMMTQDDWDKVMTTSLNGLYGTTQPTAKHMMRQRAGRIVNVTSISAITGIAGQTNYSAAKAAVIGFTRSLAKELAPLGICVNAVAPGFVETDMLAALSPQQRKEALARVPMRRFGRPEEIAALIGYLALEAPSYITGQTLVIDGGLTA
jgi:3-oxoacyl-[acyl-carrier protein] reductase